MIGVFDRPPMFLVPGSFPADMDLVDRYVFYLSTMTVDRDAKPLHAIRGLDPVPVAPTPFIILDVIVEHKDIGF